MNKKHLYTLMLFTLLVSSFVMSVHAARYTPHDDSRSGDGRPPTKIRSEFTDPVPEPVGGCNKNPDCENGGRNRING